MYLSDPHLEHGVVDPVVEQKLVNQDTLHLSAFGITHRTIADSLWRYRNAISNIENTLLL